MGYWVRIETNLSGEGDQMMFAETKDFDIFHDNHLIMVLVEDGVVDNVSDILLIALCEKQHRLRVSRRRIEDTFSVWVFANTFQYGSDSSSHFLEPFGCLFSALL